MKILITAGGTQMPIDDVRFITNFSKGTTGAVLAEHLCARHEVTLLTSGFMPSNPLFISRCRVVPFTTYADLAAAMERLITAEHYDAVIHTAAVADYGVDAVLVKNADGSLAPLPQGGKIKSGQQLLLQLTTTEKLIDKVKRDWGFTGMLVKFKLETGLTDQELVDVARRSMTPCAADLVIANCKEWFRKRAIIVAAGWETSTKRNALPHELEAVLCASS